MNAIQLRELREQRASLRISILDVIVSSIFTIFFAKCFNGLSLDNRQWMI